MGMAPRQYMLITTTARPGIVVRERVNDCQQCDPPVRILNTQDLPPLTPLTCEVGVVPCLPLKIDSGNSCAAGVLLIMAVVGRTNKENTHGKMLYVSSCGQPRTDETVGTNSKQSLDAGGAVCTIQVSGHGQDRNRLASVPSDAHEYRPCPKGGVAGVGCTKPGIHRGGPDMAELRFKVVTLQAVKQRNPLWGCTALYNPPHP